MVWCCFVAVVAVAVVAVAVGAGGLRYGVAFDVVGVVAAAIVATIIMVWSCC